MINLRALISSRTRIALLKILVLNPEGAFYINELSRRTGFSPRGVEKELKNLLSGGILKKEVSGNQHRYQLDRQCSIHSEIKGLILKTVGVSDVVKKALSSVEDKIDFAFVFAFVFGSFASGDYGSESDVDLLVVSDLPGVELAGLLGPAQNEIGRPINVSQFTPAEYRRRRARRDHFLTRATEGPRIMIIGHVDDS
jgi:DNA-binding transcriptional ArsR family regulator